ncbi:hypothetical protein GUJ93_ZPchr0014g46555 [Zizania palustris]|uniref:Phosphoribosyltransferase domain-containing protein n=1 Tax=Zizania palustris TaxID=103762 RepID=A0A8J5TH99_ZIZPA|nr:hypothetical protein GUJ93_ZPchr0014g46555 [Zizania palustris]
MHYKNIVSFQISELDSLFQILQTREEQQDAAKQLGQHNTSVFMVSQSMSRDERTLQPSVYLNKFPKGCHNLLMDPMLANAVDLLKDHGAKITQIRIISIFVAAPPTLKKLHRKFPGFIVPGLGDVGDRSYRT